MKSNIKYECKINKKHKINLNFGAPFCYTCCEMTDEGECFSYDNCEECIAHKNVIEKESKEK